jgi:hypothetical protein
MSREKSPWAVRSESDADPHISHDLREPFVCFFSTRLPQSATGGAPFASSYETMIVAPHPKGYTKFARSRA